MELTKANNNSTEPVPMISGFTDLYYHTIDRANWLITDGIDCEKTGVTDDYVDLFDHVCVGGINSWFMIYVAMAISVVLLLLIRAVTYIGCCRTHRYPTYHTMDGDDY